VKILYCSKDYSPHDYRMLQAILDGGHEVYYLRLEDSGRRLESRDIPEGVRSVDHWKSGTKRFRWTDVFSLALSLKNVIVEVRPDLIHAGPIQTVGFVAALTGFHPLVSMSWGFDLMQQADRNFVYRWLTKNVLAKSDWLFGDCRAVLNRAADFGYDLSQSTYFPWGVDLDHFTPGENTQLPTALGWKDAFVLFCNRSWEPQYGVDLVAQAFVQASRANPNLRLLLPGSGSQAELIRGILRDGGVLDKVHMPGQISFRELPEYYRAADVYLSASHTDGSSVSLMEGLACGLPAIVSDIPGNLEWVSTGDQGWTFPDGDTARLVEMILKANQSRVDLAVMSLNSRHKAEQFADWKVNQQRMMDGYKAVLKKE
jgi:L-malate glycosyltransferase